MKSVSEPRRVLGIQAHPDDADISSGGTISRWTREGREVYYVSCTSGNRGSNDPAMDPKRLGPLREQEQRRAAERLGVTEVLFLRHQDGEVEETLAFRHELASAIRELRPHVLLTHDPWARYRVHPDHRAVGFTALAAIVTAGNQMVPGEHPAWSVEEVYLFHTDQPDHGEDISATLAAKIDAVDEHATQTHFGEAGADRLRQWAERAGARYGYPLAEEFKRFSPQH